MLASGKDVEDALSELDNLEEYSMDEPSEEEDGDEEELMEELNQLRSDIKKRLLH